MWDQFYLWIGIRITSIWLYSRFIIFKEYFKFLQDKLSFVSLWNIFRKSECKELDINDDRKKKKKEIATFAKWSKTHPVLAIGTSKGRLIFYNKNNSKKIPTQGKHTKAVLDGEWN